MMHSFVHFTGDNYAEVLNAIPGYIRGYKHSIELHIFIPFKGDTVIKKNCHIIKSDNNIQVLYD